MRGHVFIAPGDLTQLSADAIAFSASNTLATNGDLYSSFDENVPGFRDWYRQLRRGKDLPLPIGTTFWMPLDPIRKPHGVVVVVSTGRDRIADKPGVAVRNAIDAAVAELRAAGRQGRLLIALPAFRVGKGGDYHQRQQSALAQVQAARAALEQHGGVDVAFLTYTPALYRIFLEARLAASGSDGPTPLIPDLERALLDGACVLFVGAGLSSGAGLPGWDELITRLSRDLKVKPAAQMDNLDLAQWYREEFGNERLAAVLRDTFSGGGTPTLAHYLLMALPVRHVITTNYDHLLERTLQALKRHPVPVVSQEDVARTGVAGVYVVKLHGDAEHPADIVLSRDDYQAFFEKRPAMALLLEGLLLNQTFFFVGYSLRDLNFRQVFSRIARMLRESRRPAFATSFEAQSETAPYLRRQWRRQQLDLVPIVGETIEQQGHAFLRFLDALAERVTMQAPPLALAPDLPGPRGLKRLRERVEEVGEELERRLADGAADEDVQFLAGVLDFLTAHGWRPSLRKPLCELYEELARHTADEAQRRRLLVAALGHADKLADAARVRKLLEE